MFVTRVERHVFGHDRQKRRSNGSCCRRSMLRWHRHDTVAGEQ